MHQNNNSISTINYEQYKKISKFITSKPETSCNIGTQTIITSTGGWRPCGKLSIREVANYFTDSEEEFIKKIKLFTIKFRSVPTYCFDCKKVDSCRGGQLCSQYNKEHKFNLEDITCLQLGCKEKTSSYKIEYPFF